MLSFYISVLSTQSSVLCYVPFPEILRFALRLGDPPGQDEERVAQPVDKHKDQRIDRVLASEPDADPLRPPAHRPGVVEQSGDPAPTREDKFLERRQILLAVVDELLQPRHVLCRHLRHGLQVLTGSGGQDPSNIEEFVLNPSELHFETCGFWSVTDLLGIEHPHKPDRGIQFIDGPVGFDSEAVLPDLLPARQACFSGVSRLGVDLRDAHILSSR